MIPQSPGDSAATGEALSGGGFSSPMGGADPFTQEIPFGELVDIADRWHNFFVIVSCAEIASYNVPMVWQMICNDLRRRHKGMANGWHGDMNYCFFVYCRSMDFYSSLNAVKETVRIFGGDPEKIKYYQAGEAAEA